MTRNSSRTADIIALARQYGRYGYRKVAELLRSTAGWVVNDKRAGGALDSGAVEGGVKG